MNELKSYSKDVNINGNLVNAYFICKRKFWLYARQLNPSPNIDLLLLGRLISENTYSREKKEIFLDIIKIDLVKKLDQNIIVCEVKKSSKGLEAAKMQVAFYLLKLKERGINAKGEILIPKEKKIVPFELTDDIETLLVNSIKDMQNLTAQEIPPPVVKTSFCKNCAFVEFCYA
ncbi:MAG: CRISPR-associated protein Cas4 [Caldimicrobium sp.]